MKFDILKETQISQIKPYGWLKNMLENERDGMPGQLDKIGYPYHLPCWQLRTMADGGFEAWWPYEQTGYWIDSITRTALLLRDEKLLKKAKDIIDTSIENAEDGYIGPEDLKTDHTSCSKWPHAVYFRALYAMWSGTGDRHYLEAIRRHYLLDCNVYERDRDCVNMETMLKVADALDDEALFKKAQESYAVFQENAKKDNKDYDYRKMLSDVPTSDHGVTISELGKIPALYYSAFGDEEQLKAAEHYFEKIANDHMLPDGVYSSEERTCGNDSLKAHESCDISDYTWSLGYLLAATGDAKYADRIERAIFNAAPGAIAPNFKAIQYFSGVNQVRAARNSTVAEFFQNTPRMAYQPHHYPECCIGNIGRAFPNYVARMYWENEDGITAALYGDSTFAGAGYEITQSGQYPFGDTVHFLFHCNEPKKMRFGLRIPAWCRNPGLTVNGSEHEIQVRNGFTYIDRVFHDNDTVTLKLPMEFLSHESPDGGIYFDYGPLLLALKMKEKWTVDKEEPRQTEDFPAYNVESDSAWNFAVSGMENPVIRRNKITDCPWWNSYPMEFDISARVLNGWTIVCKDSEWSKGDEGIDDLQIKLGATEIKEALKLTPPLPSGEFVRTHVGNMQTITLVPYGCTHTRISIFPKYEDENSHELVSDLLQKYI